MVISAKFRSAKVEVFTQVAPVTPLLPTPTTVGIIGISKTGPANKPTLVSSQAEFLARFGGFDPDFLDPDSSKQFKQMYGSLLALRVLAEGGRVVFTKVSSGTPATTNASLQAVPAFILGDVNLLGGIDTRQRYQLHIKDTIGQHIIDKIVSLPRANKVTLTAIINAINSAFSSDISGLGIPFVSSTLAKKSLSGSNLLLEGSNGVALINTVNTRLTSAGATQTFTGGSALDHTPPIVPGSLSLSLSFTSGGVNYFIRGIDNGFGEIVDNGSFAEGGTAVTITSGSTIDYLSGDVTINLSDPVPGSKQIIFNFSQGDVRQAAAGSSQSFTLLVNGGIVPKSYKVSIIDPTATPPAVIGTAEDTAGTSTLSGSGVITGGSINYTNGQVSLATASNLSGNELIVSSYEFDSKLELLSTIDPNVDAATLVFGFPTASSEAFHITGKEVTFQSVNEGSFANGTTVIVEKSQIRDFGIKVSVRDTSGRVVETFDNITTDNFKSVLDTSEFVKAVVTDPTKELGFPAIGTYVLTGGTDNIGTLSQSDWSQAINKLLEDKLLDEIDIAVIPGVWDPNTLIQLYGVAEDKNFFVIVDPPADVVNLADIIDYKHGRLTGFNTSFAIQGSHVAMYFPWVDENISVINRTITVPPSIFAVLAMVRTDHTVGVWNAPAGFTRGHIPTAVGLKTILKRDAADSLQAYPNFINPILLFPDRGFVIWGQRTLETDVSALTTGINVVRDVIAVTKNLKKILEQFLFETITPDMLSRAELAVSTFLTRLQSLGGVIDFNVTADESVNPPEVIAENRFVVAVQFQPPTVAEVITVNFVVVSQVGVTIG
jgi:hypothetical protein